MVLEIYDEATGDDPRPSITSECSDYCEHCCIVMGVTLSWNGRLCRGFVEMWELAGLESSFRDNMVISVTRSRTENSICWKWAFV